MLSLQKSGRSTLAPLFCLLCQSALMSLALGATALAQPKPAAQLTAVVQSLDGQLEVQRTGASGTAELQEKSELFNGDITNTGAASKATLLFNEGSQLQINMGSVIQLDSSVRVSGGRRSFFRLIRGEALVRARSPMAVLTPGGTVAVRGTVFHIFVNALGVTTVTVIEGVVDFFNTSGAVVVRASQASFARSGQPPTYPMPTSQAPVLIGWTEELDRAPLSPLNATPGRVVGRIVTASKPKKGFLQTALSGLIAAVIVGALINDADNSTNQNNTSTRGNFTN